MAVKGILFDKDDTLVDLAAFWREPVRKAAAYLLRCCERPWDEQLAVRLERAAGFDNGVLRPESPVVAGTNWDVMDAFAKELEAGGIQMDEAFREDGVRYLEYACIRYGAVVGKADFSALLPALKSRGIKLGVATSDHYDSAMHCLQKLRIESYFDLLLAADRVESAKPAPEMARLFCRACGIAPEETAMVGDSANDMLFAKNSGIIGIFYQSNQAPVDLPAGAVRVITDLMELPELIDRMNDAAEV